MDMIANPKICILNISLSMLPCKEIEPGKFRTGTFHRRVGDDFVARKVCTTIEIVS